MKDRYESMFPDMEQPDEEWRTSEYIVPEHKCENDCETCGCCHICCERWYCNSEGEIVIKNKYE